MSKKKPLSPELLAECHAARDLFLSKKNALKLSQAKLAKAAGMSPPAVNHYFKGENQLNIEFALVLSEMIGEPVEKFSERLASDIKRLADAAGANIGSGSASEIDSRPAPRSFDLKDEPGYTGVLQLTARGSTGDGDDNPHVEIRGVMAFKSAWLRANNLNQKHLDVIYASGNSMEPTINDGDVLLVDESRVEPKDGQIFAMQSESKGTIVKRLVKSDFDGWIIRSDNQDKTRYGDETLRDGEINEVRIIGRVVWRGGML
ncbi:putative HTH-type transcriptional regulator [Pseudomonas sp. 28 E 9]|uniref:S24 family peptidase n=1 Tax=Pseudomonas sp. 28 E 9 TaxID=1844098 RepID=UPI0008126604|nr:LexA family transcriptional regulator [Pseudomonas sp. 28 E 9]CRM05107.1 putative HTH-type transcriptional regulator [Pseudomonas sp. 28 E 9]